MDLTHTRAHICFLQLTSLRVFQWELRGKSWIRAGSSLQTQDTTASPTALLWNMCCLFSVQSLAHSTDLWPVPYLTSAQIYLNRMHAHADKHCIHLKAVEREREREDKGQWLGEVGGESSPVSESFRGTSADRKRGMERKRDCISEAGFGGCCCVFSLCSNALTLPAARLGVCRLRGFYQHASQESRPSSLTNKS